jgi:hypothetical protein
MYFIMQHQPDTSTYKPILKKNLIKRKGQKNYETKHLN